jgi:methyl-accepting chemotaxis protein
MDCWEFMKCLDTVREQCPAYLREKGRECWKVTGTKCKGGQLDLPTLEEKIKICRTCDFYKQYAEKF